MRETAASRREFIRRAGLVAGGASAAAVAIGSVPAGASTAADSTKSADGAARVAAIGATIVDAAPVLRLWDTREDGYGKLGPGGIRNVITPYDATFGIVGVVVNVTIADTEGSGYLAVYPKGPVPETSTINWYGPRQIAANSTTLFLLGGASDYNIDVYCGGGGATHFIIDEVAYLV